MIDANEVPVGGIHPIAGRDESLEAGIFRGAWQRVRSATIGNADTMSLPEARHEARKLLADFTEPARKDSGPRTPGRPMDAFAEEFLERYARRCRTQAKERLLTAEEMARLNAVLTRDEFYCPHIVAIIRLLMLTGCRLGEVVSLEWDWIRGKRIHLPDSKSGLRTAWLSSAARGHRRHPALQRRVPVPVSRATADATHRQFRAPMAPYPQQGRIARSADS